AGPAAPAPLPRPARPGPDARTLPGTWRVVEVHANGKHLWYEVSDGQVWVITHDRVTIRYKDAPAQELGYVLDTTATPRAIDLTATDDRARSSSFRGVYELKGGRLKVCRSRGSRPATLALEELERGEVLFVLERK